MRDQDILISSFKNLFKVMEKVLQNGENIKSTLDAAIKVDKSTVQHITTSLDEGNKVMKSILLRLQNNGDTYKTVIAVLTGCVLGAAAYKYISDRDSEDKRL